MNTTLTPKQYDRIVEKTAVCKPIRNSWGDMHDLLSGSTFESFKGLAEGVISEAKRYGLRKSANPQSSSVCDTIGFATTRVDGGASLKPMEGLWSEVALAAYESPRDFGFDDPELLNPHGAWALFGGICDSFSVDHSVVKAIATGDYYPDDAESEDEPKLSSLRSHLQQVRQSFSLTECSTIAAVALSARYGQIDSFKPYLCLGRDVAAANMILDKATDITGPDSVEGLPGLVFTTILLLAHLSARPLWDELKPIVQGILDEEWGSE